MAKKLPKKNLEKASGGQMMPVEKTLVNMIKNDLKDHDFSGAANANETLMGLDPKEGSILAKKIVRSQ